MENYALHAATQWLDSWLDYRWRQLDMPGFAVAIGYQDKIVFSRAYGRANLETGERLTANHLFGVASQSKMFTATALLQLVDKGVLCLDDLVTAYVSWIGEHRDKRFQELTIRQVLNHSTGLIRDGLETDFWKLEQPFPNEAALREMVLSAELVVEPNTTLKYSNLGFALLGQVVATASGQSYTQYVTERIIKPLKLRDTFADYSPNLASRMATAYSLPYDHRRRALMPRLPTQAFAPVVGVHATAADMCRFAAAHFFGNPTLLSDRFKREMQRTQIRLNQGYDSGLEFGLGLEIHPVGERRLVGHSGHLAGYMTVTFFDPYAQTAVSVAVNCRDVPNIQIIDGIFSALDWFGAHATKPTPKGLIRYNTRLCNAISIIEIVAAEDKIVAIDPDDWNPFSWPEELERINPNTLRVITPGSAFNRGELIRYTFANDNLRSVRYAGGQFLPEATYRRSFKTAASHHKK